ncbi:hypothetical protein CLOP_g16464, partial [Closterium sp. NIES-67]
LLPWRQPHLHQHPHLPLCLLPRCPVSLPVAPLASCPSSSRLYLPQAIAAAAAAGDGVAAAAATPPLQWTPQAHKYILMHCDSGQISNWVHCIRMHLLFAGLLRRTLLVNALPSETKHGYNYSILFDVAHARQCYGNDAVQTTEEYYNEYGKKAELDRVLCWRYGSIPTTARDMKSFVHIPEDVNIKGHVSKPASGTLEKFYSFFNGHTGHADVILLGDLYIYPSFKELAHPLAWGDLPFQRLPGCPNILAVQPDEWVFRAAEEFVQEKFGQKPFLSLHLRAGDLRASCEKQQLDVGCRLGPHQVVACVKRQLQQHGLAYLFIATNAANKEVQQLKQLFQARDPTPPPPPGAPIPPQASPPTWWPACAGGR